MTLEKFARQQPADFPAVAIRRNGTISLNTVAVEQFDLKETRYVGLYFDNEESLIGIKPIDEKDSMAFRVVRERGRTFTVSCQSFLKTCKIPYKEGSKIYRAGWDEKRGMVLVKIGHQEVLSNAKVDETARKNVKGI
jgi:hypothetical protein